MENMRSFNERATHFNGNLLIGFTLARRNGKYNVVVKKVGLCWFAEFFGPTEGHTKGPTIF